MIETVKVDVRKELTRQIADWKTAPPLERCAERVAREIIEDGFLFVAGVNGSFN